MRPLLFLRTGLVISVLLIGGCTLFGVDYSSTSTEPKEKSSIDQRLTSLEKQMDEMEERLRRVENKISK